MRAAFAIAALFWASNILAQNYSLVRSQIKAGGSSSAGGAFNVTGSVNATDSITPMTGDRFSVEGNFTPLTFSSPAPRPASIRLTKQGTNIIMVWPQSATGYLLEATPTVRPFIAWSIINPQRNTQSVFTTVTIPITATPQIYRLRHASSLP